MGEKQRIEYIDLAKGICIILVVFMHIVPELGKGNPFLVNLRMPLYFCLSGMFFKTYGTFSNFLVKKIDKLLIPFIAWYFISYSIYYVRVMFLGHPDHVFRITDLFLANEFYNGSIWFLLSLFWINLLYYCINKVSDKELIKILLVVSVSAIGWIWSYLGLQNYIYIGTSLTSLPFFYLGTTFIRSGLITNEYNKRRDLIISLICIGVILIFIYLPENYVKMTFYLNRLEQGNPFMLYPLALSLVIMTLILCKYIRKVPFVSYLGRFSIIVLLTHGLVRNLVTRSVEHFSGIELASTTSHLILFSVAIVSILLIIPLCKRYIPRICAQKPLLEKRRTETVAS